MKKILIALLAVGLFVGCSSNSSSGKEGAEAAVQKEIDTLKACDISPKDMGGIAELFGNTSVSEFKDAICPIFKGLAEEMKIVDVKVTDKKATVTMELKELNSEVLSDALLKSLSGFDLYSENIKDEDISKALLDAFKNVSVKDVISKDKKTIKVELSYQSGEWVIVDDSVFSDIFE